MPDIKWTAYPAAVPPIKERLLLVLSAAGEPPTIEIIDTSEVEVGYWTGNHFHSMRDDDDIVHTVTHWALLGPYLHLPNGIKLRSDRRLDPDVRG